MMGGQVIWLLELVVTKVRLVCQNAGRSCEISGGIRLGLYVLGRMQALTAEVAATKLRAAKHPGCKACRLSVSGGA